MDANQKNADMLENIFKRMPEEELPASFRFNVMRQVAKESAKIGKRNEWWGMAAIILASLAMISLAITTLIYTDLSPITLPQINLSVFPFFLYIGALTLFLLFVDYKVRRLFHKNE